MRRFLFLVLFFPLLLNAQVGKKLSILPTALNATGLDGSTAYWTITSTSGMAFGTTTDFSVMVWARHSTGPVSSVQRIIGKSFTPNARWHILCDATTAKLYVQVNDGTNNVRVDATTFAVNDGLWHLYASTFDRDGNVTLYVDGILAGTSASMASIGSLTNSNAFQIGILNGSNAWDGSIGPAQIISGYVLPAVEIQSAFLNKRFKKMYNQGSIVAWYDWKNGGLDKSGNGNNLIFAGTPIFVKMK